jgi:hypothetical protein
VASDLKSELQDFNTDLMNSVNTTEKNVLPTAQGLFVPQSMFNKCNARSL